MDISLLNLLTLIFGNLRCENPLILYDYPLRKSNLLTKLLKYSEKQKGISYIFPLLRYHTRWEEGLTREDFEFYKIDYEDRFRGQYLTRGYISYEIPEYFFGDEEKIAPYDADALAYFEKLISLCKDQKIDLVFLSLPRTENYNVQKHIGIKRLASIQT